MKQCKTLALSLCMLLLLLASCGKKEGEVTEQKQPETSQPQAAQIDPATVASVTGKVVFTGEKPKLSRLMMDQDPVCTQRHSSPVFAEDGAVNGDGTLPNVFVYVKEGADKYSFPTPAEAVELDQDGCMYKPHVLGIQTNQTLRILTKDPTTHNIHPMPKDNREWNMSQPPGSAPLEQKFARPEIMVPVKCNQHPWMRAYIGVTKNPFYAVTGTDGTFTIKGIPPGDYTLEAWTATFGIQELKVTLAPKEAKSVEFTFKSPSGS
ncbi:MAG TPA: carboxypeptidase regulatory-like domain-containing protein [Acidobacteriota bacterium]|nr:carboxypeptidase regulatory-like domain-containing protein [Acidobacteriota bacterium]